MIDWLAFPTLGGQRFSPDGKWLTYVTHAGERGWKAYVRPFLPGQPAPAATWQLTNESDIPLQILWRGDGKEVYYATAGTVFAMPVNVKAGAFQSGRPVPLFEDSSFMRGGSPLDVSRDGQKFLSLGPLERLAHSP